MVEEDEGEEVPEAEEEEDLVVAVAVAVAFEMKDHPMKSWVCKRYLCAVSNETVCQAKKQRAGSGFYHF